MGACCSGKGGNSKQDKQLRNTNTNSKGGEQNNITTGIMNISTSNFKKMESISSYTGTPIFKLYTENTAIAENNSYLIKKFLLDENNNLIKNSKLKIRKISIEELWNITKFYKYDHTRSSHLLCDFRDHTNKIQNFLKFFRTVNYTSENFQSLNDTVFFRFNKYIQDKSVIIIPQEVNNLSVENFVKFIFDLKIKTKILLFDYNIENCPNLNSHVKKMLKIMDFDNFFCLPYIFTSLRSFEHLNKNGVIFLDIIETQKNYEEGKDGKEGENKNKRKDKNLIYNLDKVNNDSKYFNICDNKYSMGNFHEAKILQFYKTFQIGLCLQLNLKSNSSSNKDSIGKRNLLNKQEKINCNNNKNSNSNEIKESKEHEKTKSNKARNKFEKRNSNKMPIEPTKSEASSTSKKKNKKEEEEQNSNKIEVSFETEEESKYDFNLRYFEINDLYYLNDLLIKKEKLLEFLECLNFEVYLNKSFILQIPSDFNTKILIAILYLIIWKVTNLKPILLKNYIRQNFYCYFQNSENYAKRKNIEIKDYKENDYLNSLTDEVFTEIAEFLSEKFDMPGISDSDVDYEYNDFIFAEVGDVNKSLIKSNKIKSEYENNLSLNLRRLRSLPNLAEKTNQNYFSLPLIIDKKPQFEENKISNMFLTCKKNEISNGLELNEIIEKLYCIENKAFLFDVINTLEKIIGNVLYNKDEYKYRLIKCESKTFSQFISTSEHAISLLQLAGFKLKSDKNQKYYFYDQSVSDEFLKTIKDELTKRKNNLSKYRGISN